MKAGTTKSRLVVLSRFNITTKGCWEWAGTRDKAGYGVLGTSSYGKIKHLKAHRVSYEFFIGLIPEKLDVLHHCDNPPCINPEHLYLGTDADNTRDKMARGRFVSVHLIGPANGMYGRVGDKNPFFGRRHSRSTKQLLREKYFARQKNHRSIAAD